jgi:hypothetical protein
MAEPKPVTPEDPNRAMIRDVVKELFKEMGPILQSIALTPEKLREAQKPYEDPLQIARELHEQENWRQQERDKEKNKADLQAHCTHKDKNGKWNVSLQHNWHDMQPRGICKICGLFIHPAYWDFRPEADAKGVVKDKAYIVPEHKLYYIVRELETFS